MSMTNNFSVYTPNSMTSVEGPWGPYNANSPLLPVFTNINVNYITPKNSSSGKIITINGINLLKSDGENNVVAVGILSVSQNQSFDNEVSFYSSIFSPVISMPNGTQEIIFDMNQLIGVNGFTFSRYMGRSFGIVLQDSEQYITYGNLESIYTIDSE